MIVFVSEVGNNQSDVKLKKQKDKSLNKEYEKEFKKRFNTNF